MKREPIKIAVLVSGGGTNLQALIDAEKSGKLKSGKIVLVVSSNKNAFALERAKAAEIPTAVIAGDGFEDALITTLEKAGAELIVLAGFMKILSERFTALYGGRIINVHPSLIPSFCGKGFYGLKVHEEVLKYGVKITGATVHFVNEIPDGGRIIMQKAVKILPDDTALSLQKRVMEQAEWKILPAACEKVCKKLSVGENL
ncbi:MAG: phosphoribosylglycinamide formyltransferase [Clostridia bacterium]|nr:phosphoribosylglycinamide formyltransferase [Clostridia bacterium]